MLPGWPDLDALSEMECERLLRVYRLGLAAGEALAERPVVAQPVTGVAVECDWAHGVCCCPGCGAVVQVVHRSHQTAKVIDGDGREHYCERQVAAVLQAHGVRGLDGLLKRHASRAPVQHDTPPPATPPGVERLTL
jgi:hypothetical protein